MAAPGVKVEVAFDSNFTTAAVSRTWTDISAYVLQSPGVQISWGRTDALSTVEPSTLSLTLDNSDGRFTAGNVSSPYYPNVKLDRPIRVTVTPVGGSASVRFTGYVDAWPVVWPAVVDTIAFAPITATSRMGRLGLWNALRSATVSHALATSAVAIYPLNDPDGSIRAQDVSGNGAPPLTVVGSGDPLSFTGSGVEFAGGEYLGGVPSILTASTPEFTLACTFVTSAVPGSNGAALIDGFGLQPGSTEFSDGRVHRVLIVRESDGTVTSYADGDPSISDDEGRTEFPITIGSSFSGTIRDVVIWHSALDATAAANDYAAFTGGYGETSDAALLRIAQYAGIPTAEVDADAGVVLMGGIDTDGMAATDALRVVETTEGGVLVDARNGDLRLIGRRARYNQSAVLTIDLSGNEIAPTYAPTLDRSLLRNEMTGTNAASSVGSVDSGSTVSARAVNQASIDAYGTAGGSVEIAAADANEPYAAASWIVANHGEPAPRVPELVANLLTMSAARQAEYLAAFVGDKVTLTNRASQDSSSSASFFVEGGTESYSSSSAALAWNVSPIGLEDSVLIINGGAQGFLNSGNYIGY